MNILLATSEVVPFSKTGGLADVSGALPQELAVLGHEIAVITPAYRNVHNARLPIQATPHRFAIPVGKRLVEGRLLRSTLPGGDVPVYLVEQNDYYNRDELYRADGEDYRDNCERFVFFCRAVMETIRLLDLSVDLIHCNDWQTGLIPAYLKIEYAANPLYENIASLLTIHNLAFQGTFWHWDMLLTGIDWRYFNWKEMEFYGNLNLLKTGIVFADAINTVSPRYAEEIQSSPLGCGLEGVLQYRRDVLSGILNGVDYSVWNPATDGILAENYEASNWQEGKAACKADLQRALGLRVQSDVPLLGFIGRLTPQKGIDLILPVMQRWADERNVQWAILGSGDDRFEAALKAIAAGHPNQVAVRTEFSDPLAHRIEAGCDMFLMPSKYEPCGLNQMYSLKYGTPPVVHSTGGLADTIVDTTPQTLANKTATGFSFEDELPSRFEEALQRACDAFADKPVWQQLVETGMQQDFSWARSTRRYEQLYQSTLSRRRQTASVS